MKQKHIYAYIEREIYHGDNENMSKHAQDKEDKTCTSSTQ